MRLTSLLSFVLGCLCACGKTEPTGPPPPSPGAVADAAPAAAPALRPITFADLDDYLPAKLAGLERKYITPVAELVVSSRYEGPSQHVYVDLRILTDVAVARGFYVAQYKAGPAVQGETVYQRHWVADGQPTAEACVMLKQKVNVCVGLSPGKADGDALPYLEALDLAALAKHAAVP